MLDAWATVETLSMIIPLLPPGSPSAELTAPGMGVGKSVALPSVTIIDITQPAEGLESAAPLPRVVQLSLIHI